MLAERTLSNDVPTLEEFRKRRDSLTTEYLIAASSNNNNNNNNNHTTTTHNNRSHSNNATNNPTDGLTNEISNNNDVNEDDEIVTATALAGAKSTDYETTCCQTIVGCLCSFFIGLSVFVATESIYVQDLLYTFCFYEGMNNLSM